MPQNRVNAAQLNKYIFDVTRKLLTFTTQTGLLTPLPLPSRTEPSGSIDGKGERAGRHNV